jgi:hypothetical protein
MEPEVWTKEKYLEFREWLWADEEHSKAVTSEEWDDYHAAAMQWEGDCPWSPELIERKQRIRELHAARLNALKDAARELYDTLDEGGLIAFMQDEKQTEEMREALIEAGPLPETVVNLVFEKDWPRVQEAAFYSQRLEERHLRRIAGDAGWAGYNRTRAERALANLHLRKELPSGRERWANRDKLVQKLLEVCGELELAAKVGENAQRRRRAG